jgi:hypothetical protein
MGEENLLYEYETGICTVRAIPVLHVSIGIVLLWLVVWENNYSLLWVMVQTFNSFHAEFNVSVLQKSPYQLVGY